MAYVVGMRNGDGWFSGGQIVAFEEALRLPTAKRLTQDLSRLLGRGLMMKRAKAPQWSVTPKGRHEAAQLIGAFDYALIEAELIGTPGAEYADARHTVIPPQFAPGPWQRAIASFLDHFPFETNVFCMTRFPKANGGLPDPVQVVIDVARDVCARHGLRLHLASDRQIVDDVFGNVGAHMWACQYGFGILENLGPSTAELNDNVLIELGSMLVMGRRCAIMKDRRSPKMPSDLASHIYKSVDFDDHGAIAGTVHGWLSNDLGLPGCDKCPSSLPVGVVTTSPAVKG